MTWQWDDPDLDDIYDALATQPGDTAKESEEAASNKPSWSYFTSIFATLAKSCNAHLANPHLWKNSNGQITFKEDKLKMAWGSFSGHLRIFFQKISDKRERENAIAALISDFPGIEPEDMKKYVSDLENLLLENEQLLEAVIALLDDQKADEVLPLDSELLKSFNIGLRNFMEDFLKKNNEWARAFKDSTPALEVPFQSHTQTIYVPTTGSRYL